MRALRRANSDADCERQMCSRQWSCVPGTASSDLDKDGQGQRQGSEREGKNEND